MTEDLRLIPGLSGVQICDFYPHSTVLFCCCCLFVIFSLWTFQGNECIHIRECSLLTEPCRQTHWPALDYLSDFIKDFMYLRVLALVCWGDAIWMKCSVSPGPCFSTLWSVSMFCYQFSDSTSIILMLFWKHWVSILFMSTLFFISNAKV